jgi:hypothetical protein
VKIDLPANPFACEIGCGREELGTPEAKVGALQEEKSKDKFFGMFHVASSASNMRRKAILKP